ncbi:hypothetical protein KVH27_09610 [Streptomyces olivaceus]|uniref:SCO2400 family protein n=1 Tax=Streptomyces olivaceus TaxID=47716 RepID=UPI0021E194EB|nr:hypothetical protein [Streptomyces olivaceus]
MDYCSSCRRHLNGALVCPGCGAYAPDIDPHVAGDDGDAVPPAPVSVPVPALAVAPVADVDVGDVPPARQQGRAARRRQLARWKKNKRRAVVASAVALVGGGLTLASMDRHSDDRAQAATASDNRDPSVGAVPQGQTPPATTAPAVPERTHRSSSAAPGPSQPQAGPTADGAAPQQPVASRHRSTATATASAEDDGGTAASGAGAGPTTAQPQPQTTAPATGGTDPGGTDPATQQPSPDPGPGDSTDPATPQTPPAAEPSSPQLCLLVVCLG